MSEAKKERTSPADPEKEKAGLTDPEEDQQIDREVDSAMREGGTGHYTSREAADPELEEEQEESDQAAAERMGRGGTDEQNR